MKRIMIFGMILLSANAWAAEWNGANTWKNTGSSQRIYEIGGFQEGYFDTVIDKFPWSDTDRYAWAGLIIQTTGFAMLDAVNAFYEDPANKDVPPSRAMRICLESLIAKTKDGPRLLAAIGVKVERK